MPNFVKFLALAIPVLSIGVIFGYYDYREAERLEIRGVVSAIDWESPNHMMPEILITEQEGKQIVFASNRIILKPGDLKVGDSFSKAADSKACKVNDTPIPCID